MNGQSSSPTTEHAVRRDKRLEGRIAVITGASSGLGAATAIKFAQSGARVVVSDLKSSGTEGQITKQFGKDSATFVACDVTDEQQIEKLVAEAVKWGGRLDIMCNYAGILAEISGPITTLRRCHDIPTEIFDRTFAINVRGVWLCCKYALKQMLEQEPREENARGERTRGWIVNSASVLGLVAGGNSPCYVPSKHAVVGMTRQMSIDYAKDRIHVNALCPGNIVDTAMLGDWLADPEVNAMVSGMHPWGVLGRAADVADAALFLSSDEAAWITGHTMVVDGGFTAQ